MVTRLDAVPDEPLNAEPITPLPAAIPRPAEAHKPKGRFRELSWALVGGLLPILVAVTVHSAIAGWSDSAIDPSNLGYSLFALSLAAIVRIVSHGSGKDLLPFLLLFGSVQMVLALYYAGTFNSSGPSKGAIVNAGHTMSASSALSTSSVRSISELLKTIADDDHAPSTTAYICLIATGIMSTAVLVRYWAPTISERTEES